MRTIHTTLQLIASATLVTLCACGPAENNENNSTTNVTNAQLLDCSSLSEAEVTLGDQVDGGVDYIIDCSANVSGDLTIEPGVIIQFKPEAGLKVSGSINAVGTADDPIIMTGEEQEAGSWRGIYVDSENAKNKLDHVTIEYAGGKEFNSNGDKGSIILYAGGKLSLTNSTIKDSANFGLNNNYDAELTFSNNTITGSELEPIQIEANLLQELDTESDLTGNGKDQVRVVGERSADAEVTWQNLSVPYFADTVLNITGDSFVTIEPGATFIFAPDTGIRIEGSGALTAEGTAEAKITFKGEVEEKGSWRGVFFRTNDPRNSFDHVELTHAGGGQFNSNGDLGAIILYADSKFKIANSSISQSGAFGINGNYDLADFEISTTTITECESAPLAIPAVVAHNIDAESDFTGNSRDYVEITRPSFSGTTETWLDLSVPYYVRGNDVLNVTGESALTLEAGTEVRFGANAGLSVTDGSLTTLGTTEARVELLGETETAESWRGVFIRTNNVNNKLTSTTIRHAGGGSFNSNGDEGGIIIYADSRLELEDVIVEESGTCGINAAYSSSLLILDGLEIALDVVTAGVCTPS